MAGNSRAPGSPTSLIAGSNASERRAIASAAAANGVPDANSSTFNTRNHRWLHIEVKCTGGTSVDWRLWTQRSGMSSEWCLDTRIGTALTDYAATVTTADDDNPSNSIVEIDGSDRVYIELLNFVGPPTVDVWVGTCGAVD